MTTLPRYYIGYLPLETLTSTKLGEPFPVIFGVPKAVDILAQTLTLAFIMTFMWSGDAGS